MHLLGAFVNRNAPDGCSRIVTRNARQMLYSKRMIDLLLSTKAFEKWATQLNGELQQLPFAMSKALNDAAFETRTKLIGDTWPSHVTVRNKGFIRAALHVDKATKHNLIVAITDKQIQGRGSLSLHDKGGTKTARSLFAIPSRNVRVGPKGVAPSQKPRALVGAFRKGDTIFQRDRHGKIKLMFTLRKSVAIKADVPFSLDFKRFMLAELRTSFPKAMAYAMRTKK
jgi:hypothetical protein